MSFLPCHTADIITLTDGVEDNAPQELEPTPAQPQQKPRRSITIENKKIKVKGEDHIIRDVPNTHVVIPHNYLKKLQNKAS